MKGKNLFFLVLLWPMLLLMPWPAASGDDRPVPGKITEPLWELLPTAYPEGEVLHYDVTWMGVTAGRLTLEVRRLGGDGRLFAIDVTAETAGLLGGIYPVEDRFRVVVEGDWRLPVQYRIDQRQRERRSTRITMFDQQSGRIVYQRDLDEPRRYQVAVPVHNEFSAFYFMRLLPLVQEDPVIVPTFADRERHEVPVLVERRETINSIFGRRQTLQVRPQLRFVGLYDKAGDPRIWLTDDQYRVPLRIRSRIAIGSLTATLTHYEGPMPTTD